MLKFLAPTPLVEITKWASKQKSLVAVPFLGKDAVKLLPIPSGSILVTRFNVAAVKAGQVSPLEVIKLLKRGVKVHSYANLHAKVYVFGKRAFIGSANVSSSSKRLTEACIETTDLKIVGQVKSFIQELTGDLVTLEQAKKMVPLYPKDGERLFGLKVGPVGKKTSLTRAKVWVYTLINKHEWPNDALVESEKITPRVQKMIKKPKERQLGTVLWNRKPLFIVGDWVIWRWKTARGFSFECPAKVIEIHRVPRTNRHLVYVDQPIDFDELSLSKIKAKMKGYSSHINFTKGGLIRHPETALQLLRIWKQHQAVI